MDIKNKNELKKRIDIFLHDFTHAEYLINEEYCKETMRIMADFIGHVNDRMDSDRRKLIKARRELREAKREIQELSEYCKNGSSGICRAKLTGKQDGEWHIGNVTWINDKSVILLKGKEWSEDLYKSSEIGYPVTEVAFAEVIPETIQRFACMMEMDGNKLFEGDVIQPEGHPTVRMEICYGKYAAYCQNDQEYMENVGFFVVSNTTGDAMPLGNTAGYAHLLGNIIDNPELKVV